MPPPGNVPSAPRLTPSVERFRESNGAPRRYTDTDPNLAFKEQQMRFAEMQVDELDEQLLQKRVPYFNDKTPLLNNLRTNLEVGGPMGLFDADFMDYEPTPSAPSMASMRPPQGKLEKKQQRQINTTKRELSDLRMKKEKRQSGNTNAMRSRPKDSTSTLQMDSVSNSDSNRELRFGSTLQLAPDTSAPQLVHPSAERSVRGTPVLEPVPANTRRPQTRTLDTARNKTPTTLGKRKDVRKRTPVRNTTQRKAQPMAPSATRTTCFPSRATTSYAFQPAPRTRSRDASRGAAAARKRVGATAANVGRSPRRPAQAQQSSIRVRPGSKPSHTAAPAARGLTPRSCRIGVQNVDVLRTLDRKVKPLPPPPPAWQQSMRAEQLRNSHRSLPTTPTRGAHKMHIDQRGVNLSPRAAPIKDPVPSSPLRRVGQRGKAKLARVTPETTANSYQSVKYSKKPQPTTRQVTSTAAPLVMRSATRTATRKDPVPVQPRRKSRTAGAPTSSVTQKNTKEQKDAVKLIRSTLEKATDEVLATVQAACDTDGDISSKEMVQLLMGVFMTERAGGPPSKLTQSFEKSSSGSDILKAVLAEKKKESVSAELTSSTQTAPIQPAASSTKLSSPEQLPFEPEEAMAAAVLNSMSTEPSKIDMSTDIPCSLNAANVLNAGPSIVPPFSAKLPEREIFADEDSPQDRFVPHIESLDHLLGNGLHPDLHREASPMDTESPSKAYVHDCVDDAVALGTSGELSMSRAGSLTPQKSRGTREQIFQSPVNFRRINIDEVDEMSGEGTPEANLRRRQKRKERRLAGDTANRINRVERLFDRVDVLLNKS